MHRQEQAAGEESLFEYRHFSKVSAKIIAHHCLARPLLYADFSFNLHLLQYPCTTLISFCRTSLDPLTPTTSSATYCVSELHGHYCNILPEALYCCYTRTTLFTTFFTCLYDRSLRLLSYHQRLLLYTLCFLRYNIAKCIARGCLLLF